MILMAAWALALAQQVPTGDAPPVVHEQRLDEVGRASLSARPDRSMIVRHRTLPSGSFAEVTMLDSGRTLVLLVEQDPTLPSNEVARLSDAAATALGAGQSGAAAIRIRPAAPSSVEQAAVRAGTEVPRLAAPPTLLAALRRRLPTEAMAVATRATVPPPGPVRPVTAPAAPVAAVVTSAAPPRAARPNGRWFVQVAALSDASRATMLAKSVDGVVRSAGRLYRVQAGPFATRAAADTARASLVRRGFADARIIAQD